MLNQKSVLMSLLALTLVSSNVFAKTIAAQSLKCGGLITLDEVNGNNILTVKKVGQSQCQTLEVDSQNIKGSLVQNTTQLKLKNELGLQLAAVVNSEVVIFNIRSTSSNPQDQIVEIERQRLAIEKDKARREQSKRNAKMAGEAVVGTAVVGAAAVDALGSSER